MLKLNLIKIIIFISVFLFSGWGFVNAQAIYPPLVVEINKPFFKFGETIKVTARVFNPFDYQIKTRIESFLSYSEREKVPVMPLYQEFFLQPNQRKEIQLYSLPVTEYFLEGEYQVLVNMLIGKERFDQQKITFQAKEIPKKIEFSIDLCRDQDCKEKSKVFSKDQKIYFNIESKIPDLSVKDFGIEANLFFPDGTKKKVPLPSSILAEKIGNYILEVEVKKEGFLPAFQKIAFAVIKEKPEFLSASVCDANSICELERGETYQNCPQDCLSPEAEKVVKTIEEERSKKEAVQSQRRAYYIGGGILLLIVIGVVIYFYRRHKSNLKKIE